MLLCIGVFIILVGWLMGLVGFFFVLVGLGLVLLVFGLGFLVGLCGVLFLMFSGCLWVFEGGSIGRFRVWVVVMFFLCLVWIVRVCRLWW